MLTELQLEIMRVLWDRGEATVPEVQGALTEPRAHSTVATLLSRLEDRRLVQHRTDRRQYVYRAAATEAEVREIAISELSEAAVPLYDGDLTAMVSHLLAVSAVSRSDLARLRELIHDLEARERGDADG
ncbi:MAG TPA: BlaI/MecI/CopY family transcriptional regulator [Longimicrobium sp.]|jgi:predicted transcriptional regulator|uniref:BlaI/MecI/CopY family transcriptional regulator n=1 Tax=Longimicrobium sp. TaxID=2029185 RepID=UPI002ED98262